MVVGTVEYADMQLVLVSAAGKWWAMGRTVERRVVLVVLALVGMDNAAALELLSAQPTSRSKHCYCADRNEGFRASRCLCPYPSVDTWATISIATSPQNPMSDERIRQITIFWTVHDSLTHGEDLQVARW
jgi:hypothetical protein